MTALQFWLFLAILAAFYGRLPATNRLERLGNWLGKIVAFICLCNAIASMGGIRLFGWRVDFPAW